MSRNHNSKKGRNGERKEPLVEKINSIVEKRILKEEDIGAFMDEKVVIKNKTDVVIENEGIKDINNEWSVENTKELLQKITQQIPKRDNVQYEFRLKLIDWDKVKFKQYSADDCQKKWRDISKRIRSYRLMKEYLQEARALLKKSGISSNNKEWKFSTKPIKPLTSFMLYYVLKKKSFMKANPTLKMIEVATLLGKKYNDLPKTKKDKFINFSKEMHEDYKVAMEKFYTAHPEAIPPKTSRNSSLKRKSATTPVKEDLPPNSSSEDSEDGSDFGKRRKTKKKPENPPISAYSLRKQSVLNKNNVEHHDIPLVERMLDIAKQRMVTSAEDKMQCREEFQYVEQNKKTELASYLQSLPEYKRPDELKKSLSKMKMDVLAKNTQRKTRNSSVQNEYSKLKNGDNQDDTPEMKEGSNNNPEVREDLIPVKKLFEGEPEKPPGTAYEIFLKNFQEQNPQADVCSAESLWAKLSEEKMKVYTKLHKEAKQKYLEDFEAFLNSLDEDQLENYSCNKSLEDEDDSSDSEGDLSDSSDREDDLNDISEGGSSSQSDD